MMGGAAGTMCMLVVPALLLVVTGAGLWALVGDNVPGFVLAHMAHAIVYVVALFVVSDGWAGKQHVDRSLSTSPSALTEAGPGGRGPQSDTASRIPRVWVQGIKWF